MKNNCLFLVLLFTVGCSSNKLFFVDADSVSNTKSSTYDSALLTGGIWVENQPLLINKDFDFGMAMSIESVGPAIAAGMRINQNKQVATSLSTLAPLNLNGKFSRAIRVSKLSLPASSSIAVYGLLYGNPQARLQAIAEIYPVDIEEKLKRFVVVSDEQNVEAWSDNNGQLIEMEFDKAFSEIASMMAFSKSLNWNMSMDESDEVSIGKFKGKKVFEDDEKTLLLSASMPTTLISLAK